MKELMISSSAFKNNEYMPKAYTGFGEDKSPGFMLSNLCEEAVSLAIIMNDLDVPFTKEFPHWLIWNIPRFEKIPENIPYGSPVVSLKNAIQGTAYGVNRYRGPKQPIFIRNTHRYKFEIYALDCFLDLDGKAGKEELVKAMEGHILQKGSITGKYKR